ncbi:hypothetical protein L0P96_14295 [Anoxybacillus flavithermus]
MRRLSQMTIDELYDREEQLLEGLNSGEAKDWIYHEIVGVYEEICRRLWGKRLKGKAVEY